MKTLSISAIKVTVLLMATVVVLNACKKNNQPENNAEAAPAGVFTKEAAISLARDYYKEASQEEIAQILDRYRKLSVEEHKIFLAARKEVEIELAVARAKTPEEKELAKQEAIASADFRNAVNEKALQQYQADINHLSGEQLESISRQVYFRPEYNILRKSHSPIGTKKTDQVAVAACTPYQYFGNAVYAGQYAGQGCYTYQTATKVGDTDCDYDFAFDGNWGNVTARSAGVTNMLTFPKLLGGCNGSVLRRKVWVDAGGLDTYVLVGYYAVHVLGGGPDNVRTYLNMVQ